MGEGEPPWAVAEREEGGGFRSGFGWQRSNALSDVTYFAVRTSDPASFCTSGALLLLAASLATTRSPPPISWSDVRRPPPLPLSYPSHSPRTARSPLLRPASIATCDLQQGGGK